MVPVYHNANPNLLSMSEIAPAVDARADRWRKGNIMIRRIGAIIFILGSTAAAWVFLGTTTALRSQDTDLKRREEVGQLWGAVQEQRAPKVYCITPLERRVPRTGPEGEKWETYTDMMSEWAPLERSAITVDLQLEHRRKGLLWYATYRAAYAGTYEMKNVSDSARDMIFEYLFPQRSGVYDNFQFVVNGDSAENINPSEGKIVWRSRFEPGESKEILVAYRTQGMDQWWYNFGDGVSQMRNFSLTMTTDFDKIDFPENSISPTSKEKTADGWKLSWTYDNLLSGVQIGMAMPRKLNPGPFAAKVTFFAPVSLFFFFFLIFIITTLRRIDMHPMNYFFLAAAFFSFHLLFAYLVDHINLHAAFAICSAVSVFLVV